MLYNEEITIAPAGVAAGKGQEFLSGGLLSK